MLDHLKAEINSFEQNLRAQVGPAELHSDKALNLFSYYAAQSDYIYFLHRYPSLSAVTISPLLDIVLDYEPGCGPSANKTLLTEVFTTSCCLDEVNKYLLYFKYNSGINYDSSIKLCGRNGAAHIYPFVSRALHGFPGSDTGIITLMDADFESLPKKKTGNKQLFSYSQTTMVLLSYQSLNKDLRDTLHGIEKGLSNLEIANSIHKSIDTINKYVRRLKDIFKKDSLVELGQISQLCRRFPMSKS